jgi:predicted nucleic acid-binding Zn ribbon protein
MSNQDTCAQCGRSCDPDYRLCDECREIEDDALQNHCAQCGCSVPPDDRLCDECQTIADEADEADEENERTRDEEDYCWLV